MAKQNLLLPEAEQVRRVIKTSREITAQRAIESERDPALIDETMQLLAQSRERLQKAGAALSRPL
jgi:hypothetical protein